jgi:HlyD family secretion protein
MNIIKSVPDTAKRYVSWFKQASLWKKIGIVIAILVVIYFITSPLRNKPVQYQTAAVTRKTIQETVSESGNIASNGQTGVSSNATGIIEELYVSNGDTVTAGQKLFKVKATATPQDQASAYANYSSALSGLQTARNTKQSLDATMWTKQQAYLTAQNNQIYKNNHSQNPATKNDYTDLEKLQIDSSVTQTQKDFDGAQQAYKTADITVVSANASVNSTGLAYNATKDTTLTAPISGKVENLAFRVGDKVSAVTTQAASTSTTTTASGSVTSSSPVLYIVTDGSSNNSLAVVQVNEVDFPKIRQGQTATVTLPAIPNKKFTGHIVKMDQLGTNTSSVISFNVYIGLDNPDTNVAPNMTINVDINTAKHENILTVPNSAIKPYKGGKAVEVLDKNKPAASQLKFIPVSVGIKGIDDTEILNGISEGAIVVTGSNSTTKPATASPLGG